MPGKLAGPRRRVHVLVRGAVQGVGFRPTAYRVAREMGLGGWIRNSGAGVDMELEGGGRTTVLVSVPRGQTVDVDWREK